MSRGFTLLELMLVLLLIGLAYGIAMPLVGTGSGGLDLKAGARQVAAGLRKARNTAIAQRQEAVLTLDVEQRRFSVSGDPRSYALPGKLEIGLYTAQSELVQERIGNIRFFPDGTSTGGRITLAAQQSQLRVEVDWLTGRVTVE